MKAAKAASAERPDATALEDLGRATLKIVHDLKNQLNGLKLYATFLRKRMETQDRPAEERETVQKLVAGLDRAARDLAMLVRYAHPLDLRQQPHTDLRTVIQTAAHDPKHRVTGALSGSLVGDIGSGGPLFGMFDPHALAEAFSALAREVCGPNPSAQMSLSLAVRRIDDYDSPCALVEWRGLSTRPAGARPDIHAAFAKRIIEAHGGVVEFDQNVIRVKLPLAE